MITRIIGNIYSTFFRKNAELCMLKQLTRILTTVLKTYTLHYTAALKYKYNARAKRNIPKYGLSDYSSMNIRDIRAADNGENINGKPI